MVTTGYYDISNGSLSHLEFTKKLPQMLVTDYLLLNHKIENILFLKLMSTWEWIEVIFACRKYWFGMTDFLFCFILAEWAHSVHLF